MADARRALSGTSDEHLMQPWQLRVGGKVVDEKPRHIMIADTFSHLAHHRGQLTVYLRLNDQPVPSIYGPTADEGWRKVDAGSLRVLSGAVVNRSLRTAAQGDSSPQSH